METRGPVKQLYEYFAEGGDSPCFLEWALGVAGDPEVREWIETLPEDKQQPNLVFAAARWHGVPAPGPYAGLRTALLSDDGTIRATILARATQTNEAGRLATLVPAFAMVADGDPIALLEVGASAGLCLYPDRWGYEWVTDDGVRTAGPAAPTLRCTVRGAGPLPSAPPTVAWRGGIDLHPLDVTDADQMAWLSMLVWPEHDDRREQLGRAIEIARTDPPEIVAGDLFDELPGQVERASQHGRVVVFHSAVIAYLEDAGARALPRPDGRAGRRRRLSLGQQRGPAGAPEGDRERAASLRAGGVLRARRRRPSRSLDARARPVDDLAVSGVRGERACGRRCCGCSLSPP